MTAHCTGNRPHLTAHAPALVTHKIAIRRIRKTSASRIARKCSQRRDVSQGDRRPHPMLPAPPKQIHNRLTTTLRRHRHIAKPQKPAEHIPPALRTDKKYSHRQTESQHHKHLGRHDPLQHVINFATHQHRQHHGTQCDKGQSIHEGGIRRSWDAIQPHRRQQHCRIG